MGIKKDISTISSIGFCISAFVAASLPLGAGTAALLIGTIQGYPLETVGLLKDLIVQGDGSMRNFILSCGAVGGLVSGAVGYFDIKRSTPQPH